MAAFRERPVAGEMVIALRLGRIDQLLARRVRPVEWNKIWCHFLARRLEKGAEPWSDRQQIGGFCDPNQWLIAGAPVNRKADWFAGQLSTSFQMLRAKFRNRLIASCPP